MKCIQKSLIILERNWKVMKIFYFDYSVYAKLEKVSNLLNFSQLISKKVSRSIICTETMKSCRITFMQFSKLFMTLIDLIESNVFWIIINFSMALPRRKFQNYHERSICFLFYDFFCLTAYQPEKKQSLKRGGNNLGEEIELFFVFFWIENVPILIFRSQF